MKLTHIALVAALMSGGILIAAPINAAGNDNKAADKGAMQQAGGQVAEQDKKFAMQAAKLGLAEVAMGKVAQQKGTDPVKKFGEHMVQEHSKANEKLMQIAQEKGIQLPQQIDERAQTKMDKLSGMAGAKFDKSYLNAQVKDHKKAVKLFEKQARDGKDAALKQFAAQTSPTLQEHLKMAEDMEKAQSR
ncbi:MAG: DUF4142 domain-containing protein [Burkholderiales bacterium]|nr:DUF4142 domain-containing protein [Burkholderiales bacterium]